VGYDRVQNPCKRRTQRSSISKRNIIETQALALHRCRTSTLPFVDNRPHGWLEEVSRIPLSYSLSLEDRCREPTPPTKLVRRDSLLRALLQCPPPVENPRRGSPSPPLHLELFRIHFHAPEHRPSPRRQAHATGNGGRLVQCPALLCSVLAPPSYSGRRLRTIRLAMSVQN
jgi:hypothetical protein